MQRGLIFSSNTERLDFMDSMLHQLYCNYHSIDPDPRVRHSFWSGTIGGFFVWLPLFGATQAQIQRYNSVPTLKQSRQYVNLIFLSCVIS